MQERSGRAPDDRIGDAGIDGEVLGPDAPGPQDGARQIRNPGWIGRNREAIERACEAAMILLPFMPPPVRLGMVAASLTAQGLLTVEDARTGRKRQGEAGLTGLGLALDAATLVASTKVAPARLVRQAGRLATLRAVVSQFEQRQRA
ncbi:MAG: hypothetical protein AAGE83_04340 [Pseudomonadota bacterium]